MLRLAAIRDDRLAKRCQRTVRLTTPTPHRHPRPRRLRPRVGGVAPRPRGPPRRPARLPGRDRDPLARRDAAALRRPSRAPGRRMPRGRSSSSPPASRSRRPTARASTGRHAFGPIAERGGLVVRSGDVAIEVARRGGRDIVRPRDPAHPYLARFTGRPPTCRTRAGSRGAGSSPHETPREVTVGSAAEGLQHVYEVPGEVEFELRGEIFRLVAFNGHAPGHPARCCSPMPRAGSPRTRRTAPSRSTRPTPTAPWCSTSTAP